MTDHIYSRADDEDETPGPSDRAFGLTVGVALLALGAWRFYAGSMWGYVFGSAGLLLLAAALIRPCSLARLNRAWMRLGGILHRIVNPIILAVLFYLVILPIGLALRLAGKDPLGLKRNANSMSYWLDRQDPRPSSTSMRQQF